MERRPLTHTEDKCACQGSILMPFNVCQPSSLLITFLPYQLQGEKKRKRLERRVGWTGGSLHTFHVVPITSAGSGAERACSSRRACNSTPPPAHRYLHHSASNSHQRQSTKLKKLKIKKKLSDWSGLLLFVVSCLFFAKSFIRGTHG